MPRWSRIQWEDMGSRWQYEEEARSALCWLGDLGKQYWLGDIEDMENISSFIRTC